ncbi:class I SAM-dependent methyltransferase [Flavobacterium arcticum]|uniref:Class I SAM-dependent methyltransferase n=1 Tax=Flavobacterium arcticum TaxID=1784713 RepID=A0A345HCV3_9FLAO|nr:class I SAM-dependent methyltransferase [Flavobacterium arcticum]AXG74413.1 class I SAM-dependent methyltransferase [Flavobacterium arcticum]KAF2512467.1 class I SAM-dependent methyltransferase [Flavobacterium arcticum]
MDINNEWNNIAKTRLLDRIEGNDLSYNEIFLPIIINKINSYDNVADILDFGCGTGELTFEISKQNFNVTGIDISENSIDIAKAFFKRSNLLFLNKSLSSLSYRSSFDLVVANMSLMDTKEISSNIIQIFDALKPKGKLLVIITHPCFWPIYWDYFSDDNFKYLEESAITQDYKTRNKVFKGFKTTHFHRPISFYVNLFVSANFNILNMQELGGLTDTVWYPRFLYFELGK